MGSRAATLSCQLSARRGLAGRVGSVPRLARIIFLAMMVSFTSAQLPLCSSSSCGTCPAQMTITGSANTYKKTNLYYTCDACSNVASGGKMYIYQGYSTTTTVTNSYLWFDCSGGGWTWSYASGSCGGGQFACTNPGQYGTVAGTFPGFSSCPGSGASCSTHSHSPHAHHPHSPHTHTPHTHTPPPPPPPPQQSPPGSSSLCQAPPTSFCCYDDPDPARPNYVCPATTSCGRGVCVPATNRLCGCSGQTYCPATSTCCGSTCCPIFSHCGGDENSCACSSNAFPKPRDDLHCGSTPADVLLAAESPGYTPGAGSCGSGSEGLPPWVIAVSVGVPIAVLAIVGVLVVCCCSCGMIAARATTSQFVGGAEMRTVEVTSAAPYYDMRPNTAFLSAAQPSTAINTVPGLPVFGADGKPI